MLAVIFCALSSHVQYAHFERGWVLPEYPQDPTDAAHPVQTAVLPAAEPAAVSGSAAGEVGLASGADAPSQVGTAFRLHLEAQDMWPYWMDAQKETTVCNSLDMQSIFLLTGTPACVGFAGHVGCVLESQTISCAREDSLGL